MLLMTILNGRNNLQKEIYNHVQYIRQFKCVERKKKLSIIIRVATRAEKKDLYSQKSFVQKKYDKEN